MKPYGRAERFSKGHPSGGSLELLLGLQERPPKESAGGVAAV